MLGALKRGCTKLIIRSVEERASGHGTGGLLVDFGGFVNHREFE